MSERCAYVGRGGLKLEHALREFALDPTGLICADLGCHVGGFTDCLLKHGAEHVYALDTGYGVLDYGLRTDDRVTVLERSNALHTDPPGGAGVRLVVMDLGWTVQRLALEAALKWISEIGVGGRILSLVKPHYEAKEMGMEDLLEGGVLSDSDAQRVANEVRSRFEGYAVREQAWTTSPIAGGGSRRKKPGNREYLALLEPISGD